jgi:phage terminase large subunit-like protein
LSLALLTCPEPPGDWHTWLVRGDRGTGKTTRGARWLLDQALAGPDKSMWAVCAPTWDMARYSLRALVALAAPGDIESCYVTARLDVTLRNKARVRGFWSDAPDGIRGCNLAGAWFDDAHLIRYYSFCRDGLFPALRTGKHPRLLVTATPPCTGLTGELVDVAASGDEGVVVTDLPERAS